MKIQEFPGKLISFEGSDGCGKSTQIELQEERIKELISQKILDFGKVIRTREPGGTEFGEKLRNILLDPDIEKTVADEMFLMSASRRHLYDKIIIPNLVYGNITLSDRLHDSSIVYQGIAGNLGLNYVREFNVYYAMRGILPDLTIIYDVSPEIIKKRMSGKKLDWMEQKGEKFYKKVREGYYELAKLDSERIIIIDGEDSIENIFEKTSKEIDKKIKKN